MTAASTTARVLPQSALNPLSCGYELPAVGPFKACNLFRGDSISYRGCPWEKGSPVEHPACKGGWTKMFITLMPMQPVEMMESYLHLAGRNASFHHIVDTLVKEGSTFAPRHFDLIAAKSAEIAYSRLMLAPVWDGKDLWLGDLRKDEGSSRWCVNIFPPEVYAYERSSLSYETGTHIMLRS